MKDLQVLQIETTNICNAKCVFCPHDKITKHGTMSNDLFNKIVYEASKYPILKHLYHY